MNLFLETDRTHDPSSVPNFFCLVTPLPRGTTLRGGHTPLQLSKEVDLSRPERGIFTPPWRLFDVDGTTGPSREVGWDRAGSTDPKGKCRSIVTLKPIRCTPEVHTTVESTSVTPWEVYTCDFWGTYLGEYVDQYGPV